MCCVYLLVYLCVLCLPFSLPLRVVSTFLSIFLFCLPLCLAFCIPLCLPFCLSFKNVICFLLKCNLLWKDGISNHVSHEVTTFQKTTSLKRLSSVKYCFEKRIIHGNWQLDWYLIVIAFEAFFNKLSLRDPSPAVFSSMKINDLPPNMENPSRSVLRREDQNIFFEQQNLCNTKTCVIYSFKSREFYPSRCPTNPPLSNRLYDLSLTSDNATSNWNCQSDKRCSKLNGTLNTCWSSLTWTDIRIVHKKLSVFSSVTGRSSSRIHLV